MGLSGGLAANGGGGGSSSGPRVVALGNRSTDYALVVNGDEEVLLTETATGNHAISFSGAVAGTTITLEITQDGTGSRVVTLPTLNVTYPVGTFALSTAAGAVDLITFYTPDGTNWRATKTGAALSLGVTSTTAAAGNDARLAGQSAAKRTLLAETIPLEITLARNTSFGYSANNLVLQKVWLPSPCTITNIITYVQTIGATLTASACFAGLYDKNGNLLGTTADQSAVWAGTTGVKAMALTAPYSWTGSLGSWLYIGYVANGTTPPKFWSLGYNGDAALANVPFQSAGTATVPAAGNGFIMATQSGVTGTLPNPATFGGGGGQLVAANTATWLAIN